MPTGTLKGEIALQDGDDTLRLVFNTEAFIAAEALLEGRSTNQIIADLEAGMNHAALRAMVYGGMRKFHPAPPAEASDLIDRVGYTEASNTVMKGLVAAFGKAEGGDSENPPAAGQTGSAGTKAGAKPD